MGESSDDDSGVVAGPVDDGAGPRSPRLSAVRRARRAERWTPFALEAANRLVGNEPGAARLETHLAGTAGLLVLADTLHGGDRRRRYPLGDQRPHGTVLASADGAEGRMRNSLLSSPPGRRRVFGHAGRHCGASGHGQSRHVRRAAASADSRAPVAPGDVLAAYRIGGRCPFGHAGHRRAAAARGVAALRSAAACADRSGSSGRRASPRWPCAGWWERRFGCRRSPTAWAAGWRAPAFLTHGCRDPSCDRRQTRGSIQVPGDGRPIVLLADRQTSGGYP